MLPGLRASFHSKAIRLQEAQQMSFAQELLPNSGFCTWCLPELHCRYACVHSCSSLTLSPRLAWWPGLSRPWSPVLTQLCFPHSAAARLCLVGKMVPRWLCCSLLVDQSQKWWQPLTESFFSEVGIRPLQTQNTCSYYHQEVWAIGLSVLHSLNPLHVFCKILSLKVAMEIL